MNNEARNANNQLIQLGKQSQSFIVIAWKNGKHAKRGTSYGLKVDEYQWSGALGL